MSAVAWLILRLNLRSCAFRSSWTIEKNNGEEGLEKVWEGRRFGTPAAHQRDSKKKVTTDALEILDKTKGKKTKGRRLKLLCRGEP